MQIKSFDLNSQVEPDNAEEDIESIIELNTDNQSGLETMGKFIPLNLNTRHIRESSRNSQLSQPSSQRYPLNAVTTSKKP